MYSWEEDRCAAIAEMVGKIFTQVISTGDVLTFVNDTEQYRFEHIQDCCESVYIESIVGDLADLQNEVLLGAEEVEGEIPADFDENDHESCSWTFYKFRTRKGYVDVRWLGESNGYYSESVSLLHRKI
jgi:hypothetical protein